MRQPTLDGTLTWLHFKFYCHKVVIIKKYVLRVGKSWDLCYHWPFSTSIVNLAPSRADLALEDSITENSK